jgi:hypothetical protein
VCHRYEDILNAKPYKRRKRGDAYMIGGSVLFKSKRKGDND